VHGIIRSWILGPETWDFVGPEYFGKFEMEGTEPYTVMVSNGHLGRLFYARFEELVEGSGH
jgi:hypothetical protein